jgi:HlyD family secretion protein
MKIVSPLFFISILFFTGCGGGNDGESIEASGTIEAVTVTLSSKTAGQITQINFEEGEFVQKGDTILIIDDESLRLQLAQLEAAGTIAQAQLDLLSKGARNEDIQQAEAQLRQAEINLRQAEIDKERMKKLFETGSITKKLLEDSKSRFEVLKQQQIALKESTDKIKNITRPEEIIQAQAKLNQVNAQTELIKKNIRDSRLTSPIEGYIVKKYFEPGESVSPMSSLLKISDLRRVNIIIYVSALELYRIKLGQSADILIDAAEEKKYKGVVSFISPQAEFTPKNIQTKDERTKLVYAVKIDIDNRSLELKSGMPADAVIYFNEQE